MTRNRDRFDCLMDGGNTHMNTFIGDTEAEALTIEELRKLSGYENAKNHVSRMYKDGLLSRTRNSQGTFAYFANLKRVKARDSGEPRRHEQFDRTSQELLGDLEQIYQHVESPTVRRQLIDARIGQGKFRSAVLALWGNACAVTGCTIVEAIRASHIKPWRKCTDLERLAPENGLPLMATLDALFDSGLISFTQQGKLLVANVVSTTEQSRLGLNGLELRKIPGQQTLAYLQEHRAQVFKG
jgi:hypothetical protein